MAQQHNTAALSPTHDDGAVPYSCVPSLAGHVRQAPAPVVVHTAHVAVQPGTQQAHNIRRAKHADKRTGVAAAACGAEATIMRQGEDSETPTFARHFRLHAYDREGEGSAEAAAQRPAFIGNTRHLHVHTHVSDVASSSAHV